MLPYFSRRTAFCTLPVPPTGRDSKNITCSRHPPFAHSIGEEGEDVLLLQAVPRLANDEQQRPFLPFWVLHADAGRRGGGGGAGGGNFQVNRTVPLAAGF